MTDTALEALRSYIIDTTETSPALETALQHAEEFHLRIPDAITGSLLSTLAAGASTPAAAGAIAVTPAAGVVGLYLLKGLGEKGHLTCIDPESEHQRQAKACFQEAGYRPAKYRFLPSRPLEVMGRLANDSYQLVYGDVAPVDQRAFFDSAWPLLSAGGVLVLADSLLDGTVSDTSRTDRDTAAARDMDAYLRDLPETLVTRLPLGAGITIVHKAE
ncbi:O-methyltransferase [Corynebacterium sp. H127]|uniref:O-methyltransferase n=1 Tax=Corynebacterium sp. H127 TaxID=3133418 RepID=UPI00403F53B7